MNEDQIKLYEEWKQLEAVTASKLNDGETYRGSESKLIKLEDLRQEFRERVWNELRPFLTPAERLELAQHLGKATNE